MVDFIFELLIFRSNVGAIDSDNLQPFVVDFLVLFTQEHSELLGQKVSSYLMLSPHEESERTDGQIYRQVLSIKL